MLSARARRLAVTAAVAIGLVPRAAQGGELRVGGRALVGGFGIGSFVGRALYVLPAFGGTVDAQLTSRVGVGWFGDVSLHSGTFGQEYCYRAPLGCSPRIARTGARTRFDALPPTHWLAIWAAPAAGAQVLWGAPEAPTSTDPGAGDTDWLARPFVEQSAGIDLRFGSTTIGPYGFVGYAFGGTRRGVPGLGPLGGFGLHLTVAL